jgi:CRP-like cAMP-binding protein
MATSPAVFVAPKRLGNAVSYLPCSLRQTYNKREVIYPPNRHSASMYLVIAGKVKVNRITDDGCDWLVDIYGPDELFGDSALIGSLNGCKAIALEAQTIVMSWTGNEVGKLILERPELGIALLQIVAQRCFDLRRRIESFLSDSVKERLALALIRFAERFGNVMHDGSVGMMPLSHKLLSQYVGASREVITQHLNRLRRDGYLRYSPGEFAFYPDAIRMACSAQPDRISNAQQSPKKTDLAKLFHVPATTVAFG